MTAYVRSTRLVEALVDSAHLSHSMAWRSARRIQGALHLSSRRILLPLDEIRRELGDAVADSLVRFAEYRIDDDTASLQLRERALALATKKE